MSKHDYERKKWHIENVIPNLEKVAFIRIFKSQIRFNTVVLYDTAYAVTPNSNDIQYCPLLAPRNQTSQGVTHPSTTLAETRLTAEF